MPLNFKMIAALVAVCLMGTPVFAQGTAQSTQITPQSTTATLSSDGQLTGNVITSTADHVPNAQVSLVSQGKVIDSVKTDASGNFSFAPTFILALTNSLVLLLECLARTH